jgi:hypothetical protein
MQLLHPSKVFVEHLAKHAKMYTLTLAGLPESVRLAALGLRAVPRTV